MTNQAQRYAVRTGTPRPLDVESHEGLVRHWVKRHQFSDGHLRGSVDRDDLLQAGRIGLMRALAKFDPSRGVTFGTYASFWVRQAMQRALQDHGCAGVRIPVHKQSSRQRSGERILPRIDALDAPLTAEGGGFTRLDTLAAPEPELDDRRARLQVAMQRAELTKRERLVIERRLAEQTLSQIGQVLNVTRERVRQIEAKAVAKLRDAVALEPDE